MNDKRFDSIKRFFDEVWANPDKFPDKSIVLSLSDGEVTKIFTKKRLQLIRTIQSKKVLSLSELAKLTKRELSAVDRDLRILESFGVVELRKEGRVIKPLIKKELLVVPLIEFSAKRLKALEERAEEVAA